MAPVVRKVAVIDTTITAAKAKLKTRKATAKRFKITSTGKVMCRHAGKQHLNEKMSKGHKKRLSKEQAVFAGDVRFSFCLCMLQSEGLR
jgi:large subunit ribosomal protein L35